MRLLHFDGHGQCALTEDLDEYGTIPAYAILSHTWGADADEVTFDDLTKNPTNDWKNKVGAEKLELCGAQAKQDGLDYFWIDTCCINKADKVELSHALNSMFRWYRTAARCYVYLSDVREGICSPVQWQPEFRKSRWFTRGWTLQELLAPDSIEFFSRGWKQKLGDKVSLKQTIREITGISITALEGAPLREFSVNERLSWNEHRQTKVEEDRAYALLGIFDVYISPFYGEGASGAFKRLMNEIEKLEKCIQDVRLSDPRDDKKRIENTKGGLLKDSYIWVLENDDFQRWRAKGTSGSLLWIKGDPGKGKTMLLCGIIDELKKTIARTEVLSFFVCQATDSRINNATAVLRGLLYMLLDQRPSLAKHVLKKHGHAGRSLFEDANAWVAISEIFADVLQDATLGSAYFVIDALDECERDLERLLDFIVQTLHPASHMKWIISSRNLPEIEAQLGQASDKIRLCLELNEESISAAVDHFIVQKVSRLAQERRYNVEIHDAVLDYLKTSASNTFLWVSLVCKNLERVAPRNVMKKLHTFPPGLDSLYERMLLQVINSDDADLCVQMLAIATVAFRPVTLAELGAIFDQGEDASGDADEELIKEIIGLCGSFLTLRGDTVYFVHQSAKDFCSTIACNTVFPSGIQEAHHSIFLKSLLVLSRTLRRDMFNLEDPAYDIEQVVLPEPDPLIASRYSCTHWVDHLCSSSGTSKRADIEEVDSFLRRYYLYWLEALSLCKSLSKGINSMIKLKSLVYEEDGDYSCLISLVEDSCRFIMSHAAVLRSYPLQTYYSGLLFSPQSSAIRGLFGKEEPEWIKIRPAHDDKWGACLQTLVGHTESVRGVTFSHDSKLLASISSHYIIKIWDVDSGEEIQMFQAVQTLIDLPQSYDIWPKSIPRPYAHLRSIIFSHDSKRLASGSEGGLIKIWNMDDRKCVQTLDGHSSSISVMAFSHDSTWLASGSCDGFIKVWDLKKENCLRTLAGDTGEVMTLAFSPDSVRLASASLDDTVRLWNPSSGECLRTLQIDHSRATFSPDLTMLAASLWRNDFIAIWDTSSGDLIKTIECGELSSPSMAFSRDSTQLAVFVEHSIQIWDIDSNVPIQCIRNGHLYPTSCFDFSHDSLRLASGSDDCTIKIWDISGQQYQSIEGHRGPVLDVSFSNDLFQCVTTSSGAIKIWDMSKGECTQALNCPKEHLSCSTFSPNSKLIVSISEFGALSIWNLETGQVQEVLNSPRITAATFSHDSTRLACASANKCIQIWDFTRSQRVKMLTDHTDLIRSVSFSHDSSQIASASLDGTLKVWNIDTGECVRTIEGHSGPLWSVAFSPDSTRLVSTSVPSLVCLGQRQERPFSHSFIFLPYNINDSSLLPYERAVKIWDSSSGACLQTLEKGKRVRSISFHPSGLLLCTETGPIPISASLASNKMDPTEPCYPQQHGGISADGEWITSGEKKVLCIPIEYRPSSAAVSGRNICIGGHSGRVWICSFGV